jgi:hypothetical protein
MVAVLPPYLQGCLGFPSRYEEERAGARRSSPLTTHRWHIKLSNPEDLKVQSDLLIDKQGIDKVRVTEFSSCGTKFLYAFDSTQWYRVQFM